MMDICFFFANFAKQMFPMWSIQLFQKIKT